jgi:hypothetical protein
MAIQGATPAGLKRPGTEQKGSFVSCCFDETFTSMIIHTIEDHSEKLNGHNGNAATLKGYI